MQRRWCLRSTPTPSLPRKEGGIARGGSFNDLFLPREIVSELDRHIIGQRDAKRAVAIALRNRWRRQQLEGDMREEVLPKNILMIGPTGVGKTEISRRLAKLAGAPFIKVEAQSSPKSVMSAATWTRSCAIWSRRHRSRARRETQGGRSQGAAQRRGARARRAGRLARRGLDPRGLPQTAARGELDDSEIEIQVADMPTMPSFDIPGMPGSQVGMINLSEMLGKTFGTRTKPRGQCARQLRHAVNEESDKLIDNDLIVQEAIKNVENNGIVFLDEIDKICARSERVGADVAAKVCSAISCR